MDKQKRTIHYLSDPMCSWCWGFSPVMERIAKEYRDRATIRIVVGGLRIGTQEKMNDQIKEVVLHHWHEVNKATGQEFCFDFDMPEDFVYDTEPPCRAVVTVRRHDASKTLGYFRALHKAFYVENKDVTDMDVLASEAEAFGMSREDFISSFETKATKRETFDDFAFAFNMGIRGFPSVVLQSGENYALLSRGYQPYESLKPHLDVWFTEVPDAVSPELN